MCQNVSTSKKTKESENNRAGTRGIRRPKEPPIVRKTEGRGEEKKKKKHRLIIA